jgi:hypothetical protein
MLHADFRFGPGHSDRCCLHSSAAAADQAADAPPGIGSTGDPATHDQADDPASDANETGNFATDPHEAGNTASRSHKTGSESPCPNSCCSRDCGKTQDEDGKS